VVLIELFSLGITAESSVRFVKKAVGDEALSGWSVEWGGGYAPSPENFRFFYFKIVHSGAFSCTNSEVLFAMKCRERYFIMVLLAIDRDTDIKNVKFSSIS